MFVVNTDVLDNVEAINAIMPPRQRTQDDVVNTGRERPFRRVPLPDILDKDRIEIVNGDVGDLLQDDASTKRIPAAHFADILTPAQHFGNELISRKQNPETS